MTTSEALARIRFRNSTALSDRRLLSPCVEATTGWALGTITLAVRYSRGADFSGTCFYTDRRIFVNLGKHLTYPYPMATNLAKAKAVGRRWYRPVYTVELRDAYEVVLFIFLHELYHLLVKRAKRNTRQKEGMCDRFAARYLADRSGVVVRGPGSRTVPRQAWDFQDLDGFVAAARDGRTRRGQVAPQALPEPKSGAAQGLLFSI